MNKLSSQLQRPFLAVNESPFRDYLLKYVPTLEVKYYPTFWCFESRAQTVFASFLRASIMPNINYVREILQLKDGGEVALDWFVEGKMKIDFIFHKIKYFFFVKGCTKNAPVVVILPGLTGGSQSEYIKTLVIAANQKGIKCCVFNNRGLGGVELKTPRLYCAANCEDLSEVIKHVHMNYPQCSSIGATGISMGGLILGMNYDLCT